MCSIFLLGASLTSFASGRPQRAIRLALLLRNGLLPVGQACSHPLPKNSTFFIRLVLLFPRLNATINNTS
jgi:hypothetical protein